MLSQKKCEYFTGVNLWWIDVSKKVIGVKNSRIGVTKRITGVKFIAFGAIIEKLEVLRGVGVTSRQD